MDEMESIKNDFIERLPTRLLKIKSDIEISDFSSAYSEAHNIKGSSGMLGLNDIANSAKELEEHLAPPISNTSLLLCVLNKLVVIADNI